MKLVINKDRSVISVGTWGTVNENDYEILDFEFPAELEEYNKRIVYYLGDERVWDTIVNNKAYITNAITTKDDVKAYVWCTKENTEREADTDFRTMLFEMHFFENENADGIVPTEEQVDGFNTMLTAMNAKIDEVDALEQTIETAEAERQENEETRQNNENTRQENEQTRQEQEAERERRTDEAIGEIEDLTEEYNQNAQQKTEAFNNNATQKTNEFNSNYTQKVNDFNTNATTQKTDFNTNASSKTSAFNSNAETKTNTFNTNATNKTNAFNSNASEKTTTFNNNASTKTSEFNTNAESKTSAFNDNATQKTTNFDNNASEKTDEFNTNAQDKIDEYDEHIVEYQAQIDELQEEVEELSENMPWNTTEQATEIDITDAAKYSKNKLELFGNTEQTQYTGVQLLDMLDVVNGYFTGDQGNTNTSTNGFHTQEYIDIGNNTSIYGRFEALDNIKIGRFYIQEYNENKESIKRSTIGIYDSVFTLGQVRKWHINLSEGTKYIRLSDYGLQKLEGESYVSQTPTKDYWNDLVKATISFTDVDIYEPYTGGQPSPNPDYPQDIHVVTGNNSVGVQGKNLFNKDVERRNAYPSGNIGEQITYVASDATYSYIKCAYLKAGTTYKISWKQNQNPTSVNDRRGRIVDESNNVLEAFTSWHSSNNEISYTPNSTGYLVLSTDKNASDIQVEEGSTATSYEPYYHADYPINLGSLELCKIGNYQDYLYKENGNWYIQKNTGKTILGKPTTGNLNTNYAYNYFSYRGEPAGIYPGIDIICSHFIGAYNIADMRNKAQYNNSVYWGSNSVFVRVDKFNTVEEYINALSANDITIIGRARTPTTTQITDETLIAQLDAIYNHLALVKGTNNITVTASDLAPYMELSYMQDLKSKLDNLDSRLALLE